MEIEQNNTPTPEELQVEQESLAEVQDNDLRSNVISSLGLEENNLDEDLVNKLVERERDHRAKLSGAIGAKIKYREQLQGFNQKSEQSQPKVEKADSKTTEQIVAERFNEEYLEDSNYPDEIKAEIRNWTGYKNVSAKAAEKAPHIQVMIGEYQKEQQLKEAAENGGGKGKSSSDGGGMPARFNDPAYMATQEGRDDYDKWDAGRK